MGDGISIRLYRKHHNKRRQTSIKAIKYQLMMLRLQNLNFDYLSTIRLCAKFGIFQPKNNTKTRHSSTETFDNKLDNHWSN